MAKGDITVAQMEERQKHRRRYSSPVAVSLGCEVTVVQKCEGKSIKKEEK
jgi:hypothetical protein